MSADSTSTEKPAGAEDGGTEEVVDSIDQSLLAIMKEVQEADGPAAPEATATAAQAGEAGNVPPTDGITAGVAPPDLEPAIQRPETRDAVVQTAESAAWETEPSLEKGPRAAQPSLAGDALAGATASASDGDQAAGVPSDDAAFEVSDAAIQVSDSAIQTSDPADELSVEALEAEAVVESILATARTSQHDAEQALGAAPAVEKDAPPSDEVLLANIVLPAAFSAVPSLPGAGEARRPPVFDEVGDDDRTTISAAPPEVEPHPARLPAPSFAGLDKVRRVTPTWPGTETVNPSSQRFGRLPRPPVRSWVRMARQVAGHRVNASVAQLAIVVVFATTFGAVVVRALGPGAPGSAGAQAIMVPERLDEAHFRALPPRPPEIAPLPATAIEVIEAAPPVEEEQPKVRPARKRALRAPTGAVATDVTAERGAEAAAGSPPSQPAAPARRAGTARPRTRHVAQQGGAWVDPFGD
jgi:hypothetical protein